ncbi:MAG: RibD family protein [Candidatus Thermoplasmatota archaeon]|jgi:2,5-diamino-6-(ribosylamino)-4(3H)-pyrimidinone 5'-phosphate reductase|nr:RibD family protein [Candidatus Thermoplasmatota archaeon]
MDRPYYHINFAMTVDGRMANPDGSRLRISSPEDIRRVHLLRQELGAILVGVNTIVMDDPKLTVKEEHVPSPRPLTKIVLDTRGRTPSNVRFLWTPGRSLIAVGNGKGKATRDRILGSNPKTNLDLDIIELGVIEGRLDLQGLSRSLIERGIERVLIEGGPSVIGSFIASNNFDRLTVYISPMLVGGKGPSLFSGLSSLDSIERLELVSSERSGEGELQDYRPIR